jgi:serine/threonine-protein kinase
LLRARESFEAIMIGQLILGKYRVQRLLDEGGMSKIYLAHKPDPPREVVVKVLKEPLRIQSRTVEHFRREIYITSRFHHANAVLCHDFATRTPHGPVLVMEYLRGLDLNTILAREGRISPERTGRLLGQLCEVLQAAHDQGIVHRDIKPGNLMILDPGKPHETLKLMDFGLAKMTTMLYISPEDLVDFNLPPASGTPEYISPEMVRGIDLDGRGDLYSVGVVLFEMLSGRRPFVRDSVEKLMLAHADDRPPSFAEVGQRDLVPGAVEAVVMSCLAKHPDGRPRTAWDLALAYEKALGRRITQGSGVRPALKLERSGVSTPSPPPGSGVRPAVAIGSGVRRAVQVPPPISEREPASRNAFEQSVEATMPEAMAIVKIRGFIYDLGGEVVESVPGMIKVRLVEPASQSSKSTRAARTPGDSGKLAGPPTDIELRMERRDPAQAARLTITLVMRPAVGPITPEWRDRCHEISRDLQAYLMGRSQ